MAEGTAHEVLSTFPQPPKEFRSDLDMSTIIRRYRDVLSGRESIIFFGYFYLSYLETHVIKHYSISGRDNIRYKLAAILNIEKAVFDELGNLTSERGDLSKARKAKGNPLNNLTHAEMKWLENKLKELITRYCELLADPNLPATLGRITK